MQEAPKTPVVYNYVFFNGQCEEALHFYEKALDAQIGLVLRFNESPDPVPEGMLPEGFENKIMHSELTIGETKIMASDGCEKEATHSGFFLALIVEDAQKAHKAFNALAEKGTVLMPLDKTFWSPCYGQVKDRFGISWMVMVPQPM